MSSVVAVPGNSEGLEKLVHVALPVRITLVSTGERTSMEMACTYDIHLRGARLWSAREVRVGDVLQVERGRNKANCRVVWTAEPASALRGQFTVQCVDQAKSPWEDDLRQVQEQFLPILNPEELKNLASHRGHENKRRRPRFSIEGAVDLIHLDGPAQRAEGQVDQLSELGCRIVGAENLRPGANLKVALNVFNISVALHGQVKYSGREHGVGVEFTDIRHGDRPLLSYVLAALGSQKKLETTKPAAAAAGF